MNHLRGVWRRPRIFSFVRLVSFKVPLQERQRRITVSIIQEYWNHVILKTGWNTTGMLPTKTDDETMKTMISNVLKGQRDQGDLWPSLLAKQAIQFYIQLDLNQKTEFLKILAMDFGTNEAQVVALAQELLKSEEGGRRRNIKALRNALVPMYEVFFDRVAQLPGGLASLVQMREDLMVILENKTHPQAHSQDDQRHKSKRSRRRAQIQTAITF